MKYSATTVSMPGLTMSGQADLLSRLGYDGIELRVRRVKDEQRKKAVPSNWGYHVNDLTPENLAGKAGDVRRALGDNGIELAGLATNPSCTDLEQIKYIVEGAAEVGAPFFRVGAADRFRGERPYREIYEETIEGFSRVLELTEGTGMKILLEIHGGTICPSASLAYRIVSHFDPGDVGVIYDPQNMVRDGFETTALAMDLLGDYLAHCHVGAHRPSPAETDQIGTVNWNWERCPMGEGLYNFPVMMENLQKIGFQGFISIEDFGDAPLEKKLADGISYLKRLEG